MLAFKHFEHRPATAIYYASGPARAIEQFCLTKKVGGWQLLVLKHFEHRPAAAIYYASGPARAIEQLSYKEGFARKRIRISVNTMQNINHGPSTTIQKPFKNNESLHKDT